MGKVKDQLQTPLYNVVVLIKFQAIISLSFRQHRALTLIAYHITHLYEPVYQSRTLPFLFFANALE